jgi:hypothetical protein
MASNGCSITRFCSAPKPAVAQAITDLQAAAADAAQVIEMHPEVGQERGRAVPLDTPDLADRSPATGDRRRALVEVLNGVEAPRCPSRIALAACRACRIATVASPGIGRPEGPSTQATSPITEISE